MSDVCITQLVTVVVRVNYSREQMIELLDGIDCDNLAALSTRQLATLLVDAANDEAEIGEPVNGLWDRLSKDSEGTAEQVDVDDWQLTNVYGEGEK